MNIGFKQFCNCGMLLAQSAWAAHLQICPSVRKVLEAEQKPVDVCYPDLVAVHKYRILDRVGLFTKAGVPVFELPSRARLRRNGAGVDLTFASYAPTWAAVIVANTENDRTAVRAMKLCIKGGDEAVKALVTLLHLAPNHDYEAAIAEFIGLEVSEPA
jgi:hypothetical protein